MKLTLKIKDLFSHTRRTDTTQSLTDSVDVGPTFEDQLSLSVKQSESTGQMADAARQVMNQVRSASLNNEVSKLVLSKSSDTKMVSLMSEDEFLDLLPANGYFH